MADGDGERDARNSAPTRGILRRIERTWRRRVRPWLAGGRVTVEPYLGYGRGRTLRARGRVLVDPGIVPARPGQPALATLRAAVRRFRSAEIPGARVEVQLVAPGADGPRARAEATSDEEGYLDVRLTSDRPLDPGWHELRFELHEPAPRDGSVRSVTGWALVPDPEAPLAVLSDLDDTVLITGATRLREVLVRTLLHDVHEREVVPGTPEFYRALADRGAPLIYVSSSPWNLHAPIARLLELNGLPRGPLILRDWGFGGERGHAGHKTSEIERVLADLPGVPFLLLGDSGQQDPEIYAALARRHPDRVAGVILRHVGDVARAEEVRGLADGAGAPFHLVTDFAEVAQVAERHGWIGADDRRACEAAVRDAIPPTAPDRGRG
jgi:phosphatidate phosphatase APP1